MEKGWTKLRWVLSTILHMCGDRSVAWEWSNSHVYWAFNCCTMFFFLHSFFFSLTLFFLFFSFCQSISLASSNDSGAISTVGWLFLADMPLSLTTNISLFSSWLSGERFFFHFLTGHFFPVCSLVLYFMCAILACFLCRSFFRFFFAELWIVIAYERESKKMRVYVKHRIYT